VQTLFDFGTWYVEPSAIDPLQPGVPITNAIRGIRFGITERKQLKDDPNRYFEASSLFSVMFHGDKDNWFRADNPDRFYVANSETATTPFTGCVDPDILLGTRSSSGNCVGCGQSIPDDGEMA
jgi:hypothetical protein